MNANTGKGVKLQAWAGLLGTVLFVGVFTVEGFLRPGYNWLSMYISALSLGPRGWIQIANFIVFGLLLLVFTNGVMQEFKGIKSARTGHYILAIIGFLYLLSGPFVMDPAGTPTDQSTIHGLLHVIFGGFVFLLMPIAMFLFLKPFRGSSDWRSFRVWTLIAAIFDAAAVIVFTVTSKAPSLQAVLGNWFGLIQRTALVPFMIWLFIFALRLFRISQKKIAN
jgi:hypothetical protein